MSQLNDLNLISLVEGYPILYDKDQARGQKNAELKDRAWRELSMKLQASERACITRWKSIRDRFGKEYRRVQENPEEPTNWDLFPHLIFLKHHYKHGNVSSEVLETVKYEPKERKRKSRNHYNGSGVGGGNCSQGEDESNNEEDVDPEELMLNQQLIALVKEHSVIYDKCKIRDSKNLTAKNEAWNEISESLGLSEEVCYKRWKKLRDRFAREFRYKQISPEKPVMWVYFDELVFLESHYRKGIPLNVDALKTTTRKPRSQSQTEDSPWGTDYPVSCEGVDSVGTVDSVNVHEEETVSETMEDFDEIEEQVLNELLLMPSVKEEPVNARLSHVEEDNEQETIETCCPDETPTQIVTTVEVEEAEDKLHDVINNIETVLKQSKDCLQALQHQKQRHREELQTNVLLLQPSLMQKVHILLEGLSEAARNKAERKIIRFLCECQIKSFNNEEIEDVQTVQIY